MMCGLETAVLTERHEAELEVAELKMLSFLVGSDQRDRSG